jgi:hypothetical protein
VTALASQGYEPGVGAAVTWSIQLTGVALQHDQTYGPSIGADTQRPRALEEGWLDLAQLGRAEHRWSTPQLRLSQTLGPGLLPSMAPDGGALLRDAQPRREVISAKER